MLRVNIKYEMLIGTDEKKRHFQSGKSALLLTRFVTG